MNTHRIRVGIDVGGTFTDAVAVDATTLNLLGQVKVPTSHHHEDGVAHGIVEALDRLLEQTGHTPEDVTFFAHGTTQATNALLEGDVATVGLIGIGAGPSAALTRRLAAFRKLELTPGKRLPLAYGHVADPDDAPAVRASTRSSGRAPKSSSRASRSASTGPRARTRWWPPPGSGGCRRPPRTTSPRCTGSTSGPVPPW